MLLSIVILSGIILFLVLPMVVLTIYYSPKHHSLLKNVWLTVLTLVTWPLVPIIVASKHKNKNLLIWFWMTFLVFVVSSSYWLVLNINEFIDFQRNYLLIN